jgi:hypothetical protein
MTEFQVKLHCQCLAGKSYLNQVNCELSFSWYDSMVARTGYDRRLLCGGRPNIV